MKVSAIKTKDTAGTAALWKEHHFDVIAVFGPLVKVAAELQGDAVTDPVGRIALCLQLALPLSEIDPVLEGEAPVVTEDVGVALTVALPLTVEEGVGSGVDASGVLQVDTAQGRVAVSSDEVSVRLAVGAA